MRLVIFFVIFVIVFAAATVRSPGGSLGLGWHSYTSYGWPQHWLHVDHITKTTTIDQDGKREGGEKSTEWKIGWRAFFVSATAAASIAGVLLIPVVLWPAKKPERNPDHVA